MSNAALPLPFPYIPGEGSVGDAEFQDRAQQNFDALARAIPDLGGRAPRIRWGTTTATFPGGTADTNTMTVSHGLGVVPAQVIIGSVYDGTGVLAGALRIDAGNTPTASTFKFFGRDVAGTVHAGTADFYWVAIG